MEQTKNVPTDTIMGTQTENNDAAAQVGLAASLTHQECRDYLKQLWGEPTKMTLGSQWHYLCNGEEHTVFMPFTERLPKSAVYDYAGREGKVRIRRNERRTTITIDCPNSKGVEAVDALWHAEPTRKALEGAYHVERERNGVANEQPNTCL